MTSRPSSSVLFLALLVLAATSLPAQPRGPRPAHQPDAVNPVFRSWEFTTKGDLVVYSVEGEEKYDEERRAFAGERDGAKVVQVTRYLKGEQVERVLESIVPKNEPPDDRFAEFYRRNGYQTTFVARMNGEVPFPCLKLENPNQGLFIYSEDVPVGGLVESVDYRSTRKLVLKGFRRAHEAAPSTIELERAFTGETAIRVERVRDTSDRSVKEAGQPQVRAGDVILREDADTVPAYFQPTGKETDRFSSSFHTLISHHANPRLVATYAVVFQHEADPSRNYSFVKQVSVAQHENQLYYIEQLMGPTGAVPEGLVFDQKVVRRLDPTSHPLRGKTVYLEGTEMQDVAGQRGRAVEKFLLLDGPYVERAATPAGGETQEVIRRRHDITVTQEATPRLSRWQQYDRWYYQETDAAGKLLDSSFEESFTMTTLRSERNIEQAELEENLELLKAALAAGQL